MIRGNILNVFTGEIYPAEIKIESGIIKCVKKIDEQFGEDFEGVIIPGLIDAHIHIESSMLIPSHFAQAVVPHGTTAVVADPHEIANVLGIQGIEFMIKDSKTVPLNFFFTAPSCVPATPFETSGAVLGPDEIENLLEKNEIVALGEMMNFPGVINDDPEVLAKINAAHSSHKPVDGHAPLLSGTDLCKYISAGISTDHECSTLEEALEKRELGMKIMIREGSSAHNMQDLIDCGGEFFVSDDKHPEDLLEGHLNKIIQKAIKMGMDPIKAVQMVTINPANHYSLNMGAISPGKKANFILIDSLESFNVKEVYIEGKLAAQNGKSLFDSNIPVVENSFSLTKKNPSDFEVGCSGKKALVRVIEVLEGQIITLESESVLKASAGYLKPDIDEDILMISVVERYGGNTMANAFVKGFGINEGALASSVAHDSHNIIAIGTDGDYLAHAVNLLTQNQGGLVAVSKNDHKFLELPVAGLMSLDNAKTVSSKLEELHNLVKDLGCDLESPFMTMSFLALLVIPNLKLSNQGLFDGSTFQFVDVIKDIID